MTGEGEPGRLAEGRGVSGSSNPEHFTLTAARNAANTANTKDEEAKAALVNLKQVRALRVEHTSLASAVESEARVLRRCSRPERPRGRREDL